MEKNYTLMKTLTAFLDLLFPRRKNSRAVNNEHVSTTGGCGNGTTVNNKFIYVNDAKQANASFLFFEQAVINDQQSTVDSPRSIEDDKKIKSKEELKKVNDELAQRNLPKPVYKTWKERVNDDLAACTAVDDPLLPPLNTSYKRKNDNINVDHIFTINNTTINTDTTRTNKNDALLPFASFSFLFTEALAKVNIRRSFSEGGLFTNIFKALKFLHQNNFKRNSEPVFIPIRICDKSNMRFSQNRFNKNQNQI